MRSALIVDSRPQFRSSLRALLEARGVLEADEAADLSAALQLVPRLQPELILLDSDLLPADVAALARELRMHTKPPRLLVVAMAASEATVLAAFRGGIQALVAKDRIGTELDMALYALDNGRSYLSPAIMESLVKAWPAISAPLAAGLSPTEQAVLQLLVRDNSPAQIAARLQLDNDKVEACRAVLYRKLRCTHMGGLVRHALRMGCSVTRELA